MSGTWGARELHFVIRVKTVDQFGRCRRHSHGKYRSAPKKFKFYYSFHLRYYILCSDDMLAYLRWIFIGVLCFQLQVKVLHDLQWDTKKVLGTRFPWQKKFWHLLQIRCRLVQLWLSLDFYRRPFVFGTRDSRTGYTKVYSVQVFSNFPTIWYPWICVYLSIPGLFTGKGKLILCCILGRCVVNGPVTNIQTNYALVQESLSKFH